MKKTKIISSPDEPLMDVPALARYMSVNVSFVRRLVRERRIPFHKLINAAVEDLAQTEQTRQLTIPLVAAGQGQIAEPTACEALARGHVAIVESTRTYRSRMLNCQAPTRRPLYVT